MKLSNALRVREYLFRPPPKSLGSAIILNDFVEISPKLFPFVHTKPKNKRKKFIQLATEGSKYMTTDKETAAITGIPEKNSSSLPKSPPVPPQSPSSSSFVRTEIARKKGGRKRGRRGKKKKGPTLPKIGPIKG